MHPLKFIFLFVLSPIFLFSQEKGLPTTAIKITGLVETETSVSYAEIAASKTTELGDFKVTNHLGEFKRAYKNVKGVCLLDFLEKIKIISSSPKLLSEYYLVFRASDSYAVVYSWNEIFNTAIGKSIFIVTEADGKPLAESTDTILMISTQDYKTGRRHVKGLMSIEVKRI